MTTHKFEEDNLFFTSDTHFSHGNIMGFCSRPFKNIEDMNEQLIANWNRVVPPDGIVFHLGDFCMGGAAEWTKILDCLNGRIYLIVGNHDLKTISRGFDERFEEIIMQMFIQVGHQNIWLNHYPFLCYGGAYHGDWQLFGHVHSGPMQHDGSVGLDTPRLKMLFPTQYDVGVDNNNYTPVSYAQVRAKIEKQIAQAKSRNIKESRVTV